MNKLKYYIFLFVIFSQLSLAQNKDSIEIHNLRHELSRLEVQLKTVEKNQLNYKIEKDLIKETYSNNYERINMVITIILGLIGGIGYLGIRDINGIKKEYVTELEKLKALQIDFKAKSKEFNIEKDKFDTEIRQILIQNEKQNRKIKFIELKEKISGLLKENKLQGALEYVNAALGIEPKDKVVLRQKARIYVRLNQFPESIKVYEKLSNIFPNDTSIKLDNIECLYFANHLKDAKTLSEKYSDDLNEKEDGKLIQFLETVELFHKKDTEKLLKKIESFIDFENLEKLEKKFKTWDLQEAKYFATYQPDSKLKKCLQYGIWYLNGEVNGQRVCDELGIETKNT
jgi:tetratricopeptide (TPR) repeat protein